MRSFLSLLIGLACASALAAPSAEMSEPVGGWRFNGLLDGRENPVVAYPTPPIDRGVQRNRTMIQGQLKAIGAQRGPHTLAVNGNPLNLYTDDQGRFARPYAFGSGPNHVQWPSAGGLEGGRGGKVSLQGGGSMRRPLGLFPARVRREGMLAPPESCASAQARRVCPV